MGSTFLGVPFSVHTFGLPIRAYQFQFITKLRVICVPPEACFSEMYFRRGDFATPVNFKKFPFYKIYLTSSLVQKASVTKKEDLLLIYS